MVRIEVAKDLPKHLKVYAVGSAFEMLYGVKAPSVPSDPTKPTKGGEWLAYLSEVRVEGGAVSGATELRSVADATVARLDTEYRASEASILAKHP
jgi:hypothetical protein